MATEGIAEAYLASGWCGRCGGKRDIDNNCPNCDRWYNHPLLTVGGSLTLAVVLTLFVGIRAVRENDLGFARLASSSLYTAQMPAFVPTMPTPTTYAGTPRFTQPAIAPAISTIPANAEKVAAMEAQLTRLESLRQEVHSNERTFRNQMPDTEASGARSTRGKMVAAVSTAESDR